MASPHNVHHNPEQHRFEADPSGTGTGPLALLAYRLRGNTLALVHTETPEEYEGRGVAGALVQAAFDYARERGLKVSPLCAFAAAWVKRHHDEVADLLA